MSKKIIFSVDFCGGSPRIEGTRLTCENIAHLLAFSGLSIIEFFNTYNYLTYEDIIMCLIYCSNKKCVEEKVIKFCFGCSLSKNDYDDQVKNFIPIEKLEDFIKSNKNFKNTFVGTINDYLNVIYGIDMWKISKILYENISAK
jgi:uncharacterized protein (DUF433 family)